MPIDLAAIGGLLGGAGQFLGGVFGGGKTSIKKQLAVAEVLAQKEQERSLKDIPLRLQAYKDAGIHPLVSIGAPTYNPSPMQVQVDSGPSIGQRMADMGQGIARAASAYQTRDERAKQEIRDGLALENMKLQNDLLRSQITRVNAPTNPPLPSWHGEGVTNPDLGYFRTSDTGLAPTYSAEAKQRTEDDLLQQLEWYARNRLNPTSLLFGPEGFGKTPMKGFYWNPFKQQYLPGPKTKKFLQKGG